MAIDPNLKSPGLIVKNIYSFSPSISLGFLVNQMLRGINMIMVVQTGLLLVVILAL